MTACLSAWLVHSWYALERHRFRKTIGASRCFLNAQTGSCQSSLQHARHHYDHVALQCVGRHPSACAPSEPTE